MSAFPPADPPTERSMSGSPSTGGSNPRKFSEKIALHNQKQAEETRAFEQLMTDLTVSRVQFQKVQQLRLTQSRAQYYGGSLPNVNQIGNASAEFQGGFHSGLDSVRGTRHHGLVERVHRERNRINSPHRRPVDKHGRQLDSSPYGAVYLSPPPDNSWRREQQPWTEEKRPGFRLISQLNRTNSDSALHTSAMNPNPQDPFGPSQQISRGPQRNGWRAVGLNEEVEGSADIFSFSGLPSKENLMGVGKLLPKQLWEAKKVQSLASRPKSCEVPGINIFPSPEQNPSLSQYQGSLSTGGSLPDLSNLQFPSPLSTPLDPDDGGAYNNLSGGSSTGNLPAAMMHLGIWNSQGLSSSLSNPSIQTSLANCQLHSSLSSPSIHSSLSSPSIHSSLSGPSVHSSLRLSGSSPRRRPTPISPLTLSPGVSKQLSPTMSPTLSPITQGVALDTSNLPREPPPPYPMYQQHQHAVDQGRQRHHTQHTQQQQHTHHTQQQQQQQHHQPVSPLHNISLDFNTNQHNNMALFSDPFMEFRQNKNFPYQLDQFGLLEHSVSGSVGGSCLDPSSSSLFGVQQPPNRTNMLYSHCGGNLPNIILTDDSLSTVPECLDTDGGFSLDDGLRIEPLSLDGLSMLSDPDMVLPDPSVEETFRSDRL